MDDRKFVILLKQLQCIGDNAVEMLSCTINRQLMSHNDIKVYYEHKLCYGKIYSCGL